jgi:Domain of unknown function (DUF4276)
MNTINIICEGRSEVSLRKPISEWLKSKGIERSPKIVFHPIDGSLYNSGKAKALVHQYVNICGLQQTIVLTDFHDGVHIFSSIDEAKSEYRRFFSLGDQLPVFFAVYEFEAWLIPYWAKLAAIAGAKMNKPRTPPEKINSSKKPSKWLSDLFEKGDRNIKYNKVKHANSIFQHEPLSIAIEECDNLKAFTHYILSLCN